MKRYVARPGTSKYSEYSEYSGCTRRKETLAGTAACLHPLVVR